MQRPSPRFRSEEYFVYEISEEMFYPNLLLVFSVTPSKKDQNHSTDKVQNLGNESG